MKKIFKLCFVDGDPYDSFGRAFFTEKEVKDQWGDDWDDRPYEHNAGYPYTNDYSKPEQGVKNGCGIYPKIEIKRVYFELGDYKTPCYGTNNSPYSVKDINNGVTAWIWNDNFKLFAGTTIEDFIKTIKENGGKIYKEEE